MKTIPLIQDIKTILLSATFAAGIFGGFIAAAQTTPKVQNIAIMHNAFAVGPGFKGGFDNITEQGYNASVVQSSLTSLKDNAGAPNRIIDRQDGPVILAGHSRGRSIITEAGKNPKVAGLVYVAAFAPNAGENIIQWSTSLPDPNRI